MPKGEKTRNNGVKCTPAEKELRLKECAVYLYENPNVRYTQFINHFTEKFDILENTANMYWKQAQEKLGSIIETELSADRKRAVVRLLKMLKKAESAGEAKLALEIAKEINKIQGLHTTKIDATTQGDKIETVDLRSLVTFSNTEDDGDTGEA